MAVDFLRLKQVTDPVAGTITIYTFGGGVYAQADLWEDVAQTQRYRGQCAEVRGEFEIAAN